MTQAFPPTSAAPPTGVTATRSPAAWRHWTLAILILAPIAVLVGDALLRPAGPRTPPPADAAPGRWVYLEGAANTRDAGGYATADGGQVKRGMLYRSATLARLSARGADDFRQLGVRTVIDMRNRLTPWPPFNGDVWSVYVAAAVHGCPMSFAKDGPPEEFYIRGVRDNAASFRAALELLSHAEHYPVLVHCAAGTDRTGVLTALLHRLLGVARETIIADFRLSEQVGLPGSLEALHALLDDVDARGGIGPYLSELGVPPDTQARIRAVLLEPR